jgi:hypothetical protein
VLEVGNSIPVIAEMFHIIPEAFIMLLLDSFQSCSDRWSLICALQVAGEHGAKLILVVDGSLR